jgi:uncharacterized membrane protein YecN with MAPEG domain
VVSAFTAGVLIVLQMALLLSVVVTRRHRRQSLGDGGDSDLLRAIRRHGNLAENAGIFIAGFTLLELLGVGRLRLEVICGAFVLGRVSHAIGLSRKHTVNPFRIGGVFVTVAVGLTLGVWLIRKTLPYMFS